MTTKAQSSAGRKPGQKYEKIELRELVLKWNRGKPREGIETLVKMMQLARSPRETTLMFGNRQNVLVSILRHEENTLEITGGGPDDPGFRRFRLPPVLDGQLGNMYQPLWKLVQRCLDEAISCFIMKNFCPPMAFPPGPEIMDDLHQVTMNQVNRTTTSSHAVRSLAREFQSNLLEMIDRDALEILTDITGAGIIDPDWEDGEHARQYITLWRYNIAAALGNDLRNLWEHNPGAVTWTLMQGEPQETIRHPGQVVQIAQEGMMQAGLERKNWKFATKLPSRIMQEVIKHHNRYNPAWAVNHMAEARAIPTPEIASSAILMLPVRVVVQQQAEPNGIPPNGILPNGILPNDEQAYEGLRTIEQENYGRTLRLMFRESQACPLEDQRIIRQARDLPDYIEAMCRGQVRIESNSWNGLIDRSARWHREMNEREDQQQRRNLIDRDQGYLRWNSLIQLVEIDGFEIAPLTSELDLLEEAREMRHCVSGYGSTCANGGSRIFSITREGKRVATMEIQLTRRSWTINQIRGVQNHAVEPEVEQAGREIAKRYTHEWEQNPNHESWQVRHVPLELEPAGPEPAG